MGNGGCAIGQNPFDLNQRLLNDLAGAWGKAPTEDSDDTSPE